MVTGLWKSGAKFGRWLSGRSIKRTWKLRGKVSRRRRRTGGKRFKKSFRRRRASTRWTENFTRVKAKLDIDVPVTFGPSMANWVINNKMSFKASDFPDLKPHFQKYDMYKMAAVKVKIMWPWLSGANNQADWLATVEAGAVPNAPGGRTSFAWAPDYDDDPGAQVLKSFDDVADRGNARVYDHMQGVLKMYVKNPAMASSAYNGALSTAAYTPRRAWIDSAYPSVPHYGLVYALKGEIPKPSDTNPFSLRLKFRVTVYMLFKHRMNVVKQEVNQVAPALEVVGVDDYDILQNNGVDPGVYNENDGEAFPDPAPAPEPEP